MNSQQVGWKADRDQLEVHLAGEWTLRTVPRIEPQIQALH